MRKTGFFRRDYEDLRRVFNPKRGLYELFDIPIISGDENTPHPTQKPVALIEKLIEASSMEGGTVLDPFVGSGTTLAACRKTNRNGIGFELNPDYEPLIRERSMAHTPPLTSYL